jgi:hypothetical protein
VRLEWEKETTHRTGGTLGDSVFFMTEDEVDLPNSIGAPATRALLGAGYSSSNGVRHELSGIAGLPRET